MRDGLQPQYEFTSANRPEGTGGVWESGLHWITRDVRGWLKVKGRLLLGVVLVLALDLGRCLEDEHVATDAPPGPRESELT